MNTEAIFRPTYLTGRELNEARESGLTRVEISYYADTCKAAEFFYRPDFTEKATQDIEDVVLSLNTVKGFCHKISIVKMMEAFQDKAKVHQLYIQCPDICAMIYARSLKKKHFCGFFKDITKPTQFNYKNFIAVNGLPGPYSNIRCLIYSQGLFASEQEYLYQKSD